MFRSLTLSALLAATLFALPQTPIELAARNAASWANSVAPGGFVSISIPPSGVAFGPDSVITLTPANGTAIQITPVVRPNATATPFGAFEVWFIVPENTPLGTAMVTSTTRGTTYSNPIEIAKSAPGVFTIDYTAAAPARAVNDPATPNALTSAAVPNGIVLLFATGLNGAPAEDVRVELAGRPIVPLYAGPQGTPGLDQINFVVPQDAPLGCYVPLTIRVRGVLSNQTSLSINSDPSTCTHPLGLSNSDLKTLDAGGSISVGLFSVSSNILPPEQSPISPIDSAMLLFGFANAGNVAGLSGIQVPGAQTFSCAAGGYGGSSGGSTNNLNAGTVSVSGPGGKQFDLKRSSYYSGGAPINGTTFFSQGVWRASASGGPDIGAFQTYFTLPPRLKLTNLDETTTVPSQGYTVRWDPTGFSPADVMTLSLSANANFANYVACSAPAWAGQLVLPNSVLEQFKGTTTAFNVAVRPIPALRTFFSIPNNSGTPIRGFVDYSFTEQFSARVQ